MEFDIVCFGSAVIDVFMITKAEEKDDNIIIPYGSKILIEDLYFEIGGGGTNTSVAFSRFGFKTGYIGKVGSDSNAKEILNLLKEEKITFLGSQTTGKTSGYSVIIQNKDKNRSILTYKGINDEITLKEIKPFTSKWLYLSSAMKKSFQSQIQLAKKLKQNGTKIVFNPSEYLIKELDLRPILKLCDVLILNQREATLLTKSKNPIKDLYSMGPKIVVITNEQKTIYAYDGSKEYSINPPKVKVVDKTGSGDAFASGFTAGLIINKDIDYCMKLGVREAVSVLSKIGAKNNLLRKNLK
jgi:ribokinase